MAVVAFYRASSLPLVTLWPLMLCLLVAASASAILAMRTWPHGPVTTRQFHSEVTSVTHYANTFKPPTSPPQALIDSREAAHLVGDAAPASIVTSRAPSNANAWNFNLSVNGSTNQVCLSYERVPTLWVTRHGPCVR